MNPRMAMILSLFSILILPAIPQATFAHCEIPCGIYDDEARLNLMAEHITTIEKSMANIIEISAAGEKNFNQLVRWVTNKEEHATKFMIIVTRYFMTQRIKVVAPGADGYDNYVEKVTLLHGMLRTAMKCKQTTDAANAAALSSQLQEFQDLYMAGH